jgi:hypothetical protein
MKKKIKKFRGTVPLMYPMRAVYMAAFLLSHLSSLCASRISNVPSILRTWLRI